MATTLLTLVENHAYQRLFLEHLRWSRPDMANLSITLDEDRSFTAVNASSYKGLRVWVCPDLPTSADQVAIDRAIAKQSTDRIVIFHNKDKQVWRWPSRIVKGSSTTTRLTSHVHVNGKDNPKLLDRLNRITLDASEDLSATAVIDRVKQAFDVETEKESKRASKLMASMYDALSTAGAPEHDISVTLARILFLMFGDDTDMWDADLFQNFIINHTQVDGSDLAERINELFAHLNTEPDNVKNIPSHLKGFKYVNGGIFSEPIKLDVVGSELRATILDACTTDWSDISPAIFGSMFQSVRNAETRREFGEHYTSERDILRTLNPLFLNELRQEFLDASNLGKKGRKRLRALRSRLAKIQFLDPACGCGNFIIIAYRELRLLEIAIVEKLRELSGGKPVFTEGQVTLLVPGSQKEIDQDNQDTVDDPSPVVTLDNYYGIEIDEWPAKIAETAMFLTDQQCDLQMQKRLGYAPERLPISRQATIVTATVKDPFRGNAMDLEWSEVLTPSDDTVVAGNPPYVGGRLKSAEQTADLRRVWGEEFSGDLDYVTGWHAKTMDFLAPAKDSRFAFVTTNSIVQGAMVPSLFGPIQRKGWRIRFAHRTFAWESEASGAAAVHCVIVGFDRASGSADLWDYEQGIEKHTKARSINAYLVDGPPVLVASRRAPLGAVSKVNFGSMANDGGHLIVNSQDYVEVVGDPLAAKYLRRLVGSEELVNNIERWCLWLDEVEPSELMDSHILKSRVEATRAHRARSTRLATQKLAATPHLFGERRQPTVDYLCVPKTVSENRPYFTAMPLNKETVTSDAAFTAEDPDGFLFAIVSSSMFLTWQKTVGGRLKSDLRFSGTLVWNNLPLSKVSKEMRESIIRAGNEVLQTRQVHPERSLAEHYSWDAMDPALQEAHDALDALVDRAFGAESTCTNDKDRQEILFRQYQSLTAGN